jgi:hypothetical protein
MVSSVVAQQLLFSTDASNIVTFTGLNIPVQPNAIYWVAVTANTNTQITWSAANTDTGSIAPATDYNLLMTSTSTGTSYTYTAGIYYRMTINA